jgi:hypothetical protein
MQSIASNADHALTKTALKKSPHFLDAALLGLKPKAAFPRFDSPEIGRATDVDVGGL